MRTRIPDYFDRFHCLAGACPDTCCGQWQIVVDPKAKERYLSVQGELGDRIRAALTTVDGEDCMKLEHGRCPLLTKDGLCPIVQHLGEDFLSTSCHTYPRFTEIYGGLQETALSVSCPEAARLLLQRQEPLTFETATDDTPPELTDLDADQFRILLMGRQTAFALLQDRSRPLADRLALFLCFSQKLQSCLKSSRRSQRLNRRFLDASYQERLLRRIRHLRKGGSAEPMLELLRSMEPLGSGWTVPASCSVPEGIPLEQLAVYFVFRWWLKAACNGRLWRQAAAVTVSVLTVAALNARMGDILSAARIYSRQVEHSEENLSLLRRAMERPQFSLRRLLRLLEVG